MEFGIFHEFPSLSGRTDAESFAAAFDVVDGAEKWGLDAVWLAELHFDPERSVLSSPMCIASAIAARTERMKIGLAVQVLPLCNPLRIAEEAATVDQISHGRLIFGVGRSGVAKTYEAYGVPYAESRERFAETLEIIVKAWTEPVMSFRGRFNSFRDVTVTPKPFQNPMPPIRVAATSADTFTTAGRRPTASVRGNARLGIDPWLEHGHVRGYPSAPSSLNSRGSGVSPSLARRAPGFIGTRAAEARTDAEASQLHYYRAQAKLLADSAGRTGVDQVTRRNETAERLATITYEEALRGSVFIGTPDSVSAQLRALQDELGLDGVLLELNSGGKIPHQRVMAATRPLCQEVMPRFH